MSIDFSCPKCKKKYRVKEELAGKAAKCAKCDHRMKIPVPAPVAEPDPLQDLSDLFDDDFAAAAMSGEVVDSPKNNPERISFDHQCPSCGTGLKSDAALCVDCGYDLRSGSHHKMKKEKPAKAKSAAVEQTATLMKGVVFSIIGAAIGAAVWVGVVVATDYEIGWIAWGLGAATGAGMALGKGDDTGEFSGIVAGGIALLGIVAAKFGIYQYLISQITELGITIDQLEAISGETISIGSLFGPIDGLFILLALASAYKIGSGQSDD